MLRRARELWYSLAAVVVVTALYALARQHEGRLPVPSSLIGHGIGIVGFVLMLMAATLYTIRKRLTDARWGSLEAWLRFHMVTGLVGPYMVLLHTAMWFHGLAAAAMLLTVVVVVSGVVGRYLYTAVPRAVEGPEPDAVDLLIARYETSGKFSADLGMTAAVTPVGGGRLTAGRRLLAPWRSIHVSLTWALAVTAIVHMAGALYYELGP